MNVTMMLLAALALIPQPRELTVSGGETATSAKITCVTDKTIPPEGYRLSVKAEGVTISSSSAAGEFYARQTLLQLADGKKELQNGQSKLAAGEEELRAGAEKLKDGLSQLEEFEDGMKLVDENLMLIYTQDSVYRHNGELAIGNPQETLGKDFSWYKKTEDGQIAALRNGEPYVDLDKGMEVCTEFRAFVDAQHDDCQSELYSRVATYAILALAAILGIVAGTLALCGKGFSGILGIVTAALVIAANLLGAFTRYFGYTYPLKDGTYSGTVQLFALLFTAATAVLFAVAAMIDRSKARAEA